MKIALESPVELTDIHLKTTLIYGTVTVEKE